MLQFINVSNPEQIKAWLSKYEPLTDTWIVSDLKSKQEIQQEALCKHSFYTDDAILRVSDFWRLWIRRLEPTLQVVSSDFIKTLVQHFVDVEGAKLEISDTEVSTLNKAVNEFAPILLHPESDRVLQEWLNEQPGKKKWERWYQLAGICLNFIVNSKRAIDAKWSAAYLQTADLSNFKWDRKIYVDLGSEMSGIEMSLLKQLSQATDIFIFAPAPAWKDKFPHLLNTYFDNFGYGAQSSELQKGTYKIKPEQFVRFSTQLGEVKFAVAKVRAWADAGVPLESIAIVSSEIETYWPVLQYYLEEEGVSYQKDSVAQLNSLGDIQNLLAAFKNHSQDVAWDSLERAFFGNESALEYRYEKFKAVFYQLYDEDDLARDQKIKNLFYKKLDFGTEFERDEFLSFLVKIWMTVSSPGKNDIFELLIKDFLAQSLNVKMKFSRWSQFLKNRLSHKEITVARSSQGLHVLPLMSAQMLNVSHRIVIGLNDEYYHRRKNVLMPFPDSNELKKTFDLAVEAAEESYLDFNLRWQCLSANENTILTSSHLSFKSEPLNSSLFFIENSPKGEFVSPPPTRADERQLELASPGVIAANERFTQDKVGYQVQLKSPVFQTLATADLENYAKCSFKLLAGRGFRLRDYSQVAIDLDPRDKGTIIHKLFEFCIGLMQNGGFDTEKVAAFLNERRAEGRLNSGMDAVWNVQFEKFMSLAKKFYQFEKERIKIFSVTTEKDVEMFFDLEKREFTSQKPNAFFGFKMRLDRIDTHKASNYRIIYDYKASIGSLNASSKWLSEYQFQMLLYTVALKLELGDADLVKGSLYYLYKDFTFQRGMVDKEIGTTMLGIKGQNRSLMTDDKREKLEQDFVTLAGEILGKLANGEFAPVPYDTSICESCDWRKMCRATHLM